MDLGRGLLMGALGFAGWHAAGYVWDIYVREALARAEARRVRESSGKPWLDVGTGTQQTSLRCAVTGVPLCADAHLDLAAPRGRAGPDRVVYGDVEDLSEWEDGTFSVATAFHVLEHVEEPWRAMRELTRVADRVLIIVPSWWCLHTWAHPGHLWYLAPGSSSGMKMIRLRDGRRLEGRAARGVKAR